MTAALKQDEHTANAPYGLAILVCSFFIYWGCSQRQVYDSHFAMLISNELIRFRTFNLDRHFGDRSSHPRWEPTAHIDQRSGHYFYVYPYGTSVLSAPFVEILNLLSGRRFETPEGGYDWRYEQWIQAILAAGVTSVLALYLFKTASICTSPRFAAVMVLSTAFGSQMMTTASRGLWSHSWGILLLGLALYVLFAGHKRRQTQPVLLATLLAACYFVRPTFIISGVAVGGYLLFRDRRACLTYVATASVWGALFLLWSWFTFGAWVPFYYQGHLLTGERLAEGLCGTLVSPARGLFIHVPATLIVVYLAIRYLRHSTYRTIAVVAMASIAAHWVVVSASHMWWGGHSVGPRLLTDVLPWWFALALCGFDGMRSSPTPRGLRSAEWGVAALLVSLGFCINVIGATCPGPMNWNSLPANVDEQPSRLWDWKDLPFLRPIRTTFGDAVVRDFSRFPVCQRSRWPR